MSLNFNGINIGGVPSGGGGTSNHSQLTNLDYANAGHTGFMSSANYLPDGTVINVKADGTGDFTNLPDAISSLTGKWSNGTITIDISPDSYTYNSFIDISGVTFNIPRLIIKGKSQSETVLNFPNMHTSGAIRVVDNPNIIEFKDFKMVLAGKTAAPGRGINIVRSQGLTICTRVTVSDIDAGICVVEHSECYIRNCSFINCGFGSYNSLSSNTYLYNCTFNNCFTGIGLYKGAIISLEGTGTFVNTNNQYGQALVTPTSNGIIFGSW